MAYNVYFARPGVGYLFDGDYETQAAADARVAMRQAEGWPTICLDNHVIVPDAFYRDEVTSLERVRGLALGLNCSPDDVAADLAGSLTAVLDGLWARVRDLESALALLRSSPSASVYESKKIEGWSQAPDPTKDLFMMVLGGTIPGILSGQPERVAEPGENYENIPRRHSVLSLRPSWGPNAYDQPPPLGTPARDEAWFEVVPVNTPEGMFPRSSHFSVAHTLYVGTLAGITAAFRNCVEHAATTALYPSGAEGPLVPTLQGQQGAAIYGMHQQTLRAVLAEYGGLERGYVQLPTRYNHSAHTQYAMELEQRGGPPLPPDASIIRHTDAQVAEFMQRRQSWTAVDFQRFVQRLRSRVLEREVRARGEPSVVETVPIEPIPPGGRRSISLDDHDQRYAEEE